MPTPIYKCPDCGARVIYNETKNFWKCQKCGQEFSESDVFIQGLEEWKADAAKEIKPAPQISEKTIQQEEPSQKPKLENKPREEYKLSDEYAQKKNEKTEIFLKESASSIKLFGNIKTTLILFYIIEAIFFAIFFYIKIGVGFMYFTPLIILFTFIILENIPTAIRSEITNKAIKFFDEIKGVNDKFMICGGKSCKTYFSIPDVEEGYGDVNYKCFINNQYLSFGDINLGYWTKGKNRDFKTLEKGWGLTKSHKLSNWYFMMIYKCGFRAAPNKHTFSCKDYLGDDDFSDFRIRVSDTKVLTEWKISNLKTVLKTIDKLLSDIPFAIAIENRSIKILFLTNHSTFNPKSFDNYDEDTVSTQFSMLYDMVEMAKALSSIEVEEDPEATPIELTELDSLPQNNGNKI